MPLRASSRAAAALICGASTEATQPESSATRRCGCAPSCADRRGRYRADPASGGGPARAAPSRRARQARDAPARVRRGRPGARPSAAGQPYVRQHPREQCAQQALRRRPAERLLDMGARVIDEMHVVHPGRTGGHTGQTGEAAIDMGHDFGRGRLTVLQHLLDQVDAPARRVRARRRAARTVGQVAVQSRNAHRPAELSASAVCGSASCARLKLVCIGTA